MKFRILRSSFSQIQAAALLFPVFEDDSRFLRSVAALDRQMKGILSEALQSGGMTGKFKEFMILMPEKFSFTHLVVVGAGKRKKYNLDTFRSVVAKGSRIARRLGVASLAVGIGKSGELPAEVSAQAAVEGSILGLYRFRKYKTKDPEKPEKKKVELEELLLVTEDAKEVAPAEKGAERGKILSEAVNFVRDLVNEPSNVMTPTAFAEAAQDVAKKHKLSIKVYERDEIEDFGMEAFLSVAKGSRQPPKLVILEYKGGGKGAFTLGLVGKGITFDSGGISIKPAEDMDHMTDDMAGAAVCLGTVRAIAALELPLNVIAVMPLAENLPGGDAYKPGDIVKTHSGKTIEVMNTDAEGRMLLADALSFASKMQVNALVDVATLTGAVRVALGLFVSGVFSTDEALCGELMAAAKESDEALWRLPLFPEYGLQVKGSLADLKNSAGRYGGASTAAAFLKEFVGDVPWAHVDIAGTARVEADRMLYIQHPYYPKNGASGVGVRLLTHLAQRLSKKRAPQAKQPA